MGGKEGDEKRSEKVRRRVAEKEREERKKRKEGKERERREK